MGRFIQPDTIVPYPNDPQSFNRYAYARNNPIRYIDPTGHSFWDSFKKFIGHIVGAIAGIAATIGSGGNLWMGFQAYSFVSSTVNSAISGNWGGLAGGIAGGLIGGAFGWQAATSGAALFTKEAAGTFAAGFLTGAIEFGAAGFGAGFGAALGSGASFGDAAAAGLVTGAISGTVGGVIQGSYMAGWQNQWYGASKEDIAFERVRGRLPTPAERKYLESFFPGLKGKKFKITGEQTGRYNCIAWTLGKTNEWVNPTPTVGGMDSLYGVAGYKVAPEDKAVIALFVKHAVPQHGAVRISGDLYESKLGSLHRIVHPLRTLEGKTYGHVERFYGR